MALVLLAAAFGLVILNGFFVATEFAMVRVRHTRLQSLVDEGKPGAANAMRMVTQLDRYLSATQFGVTLASLGLGWIGERAFGDRLEPLANWVLRAVGAFPTPEAAYDIAHGIALALSFALITVLHIVLGEVVPKNLAIRRAEPIMLKVSLAMRLFYVLCFPAIWIVYSFANSLLRRLRIQTAPESHEAVDEAEVRMILARSAATGMITTSRVELIERALEMAQKTARQVLVPRSQVRSLDLEEPLEKNLQAARASGHTWLPVIRGTLDQVEGVVNVKDLFFLLSKGELTSLSQVQRPVLFVPENVSLEQLLSEFRRRRRQLAMVVDEHGGTSGIVTLADVVAEVVGDVAELGRKVEEVRTLPGGRLELPGTAQLEDLEDRLDVEFDVDHSEVSTIAGYLMAKLKRIPQPGDKVPVGEYEIFVEQLDGPRVTKVRVEPRVVPKPASEAAPR